MAFVGEGSEIVGLCGGGEGEWGGVLDGGELIEFMGDGGGGEEGETGEVVEGGDCVDAEGEDREGISGCRLVGASMGSVLK